MPSQRDIRSAAVQWLYQLDAQPGATVDQVLGLRDDLPLSQADQRKAMDLARGAWADHAAADALASDLAPAWPTLRQPAVDRAILRLAYHEMTSGITPPKVAINEAVELAKLFSTERSPAFINGVLDKMMRHLRDKPGSVEPSSADENASSDGKPGPHAGASADPWLDDALRDDKAAGPPPDSTDS
jgi:N utilization substance protein B